LVVADALIYYNYSERYRAQETIRDIAAG